MTDVRLLLAGAAVFIASVWCIPLAADLLSMPMTLAYIVVGAIPSFVAGMLVHAGVTR